MLAILISIFRKNDWVETHNLQIYENLRSEMKQQSFNNKKINKQTSVFHDTNFIPFSDADQSFRICHWHKGHFCVCRQDRHKLRERDRKSKRCRKKEREGEKDVNRNGLVQQSNCEIRTKSPDVKYWFSIEFRKLTVVANWASAALSWRIPTKILQFLKKENSNCFVIIRISKKKIQSKKIYGNVCCVYFFSLHCLMRPLKVSRKAMELTLFKHDGWFLLRCTSNWKQPYIQLVCCFFTVASVPYITHRIHRRI